MTGAARGRELEGPVRYVSLPSPVGPLTLVGGDTGLRTLSFADGRHPLKISRDWREDGGTFRETIRQLDAYFSGRLREFDIPLAPEGTHFQLQVWSALRTIPYGSTLSYGQLAGRIGRANASRAVGAANGRNPIAIIIPCHRVIGADGSLTGFGGGLGIKRKLLELEGSLRYLPGLGA